MTLARWLLVLVLALGLVGCGTRAAPPGASAPAASAGAMDSAVVQVVHPQRQTLQRVLKLPGTIQALYRVDLVSRVSGYVADFSLDRGDRVRKGQIIARIDVPEMAAELAQAHADVTAAQAELKGHVATSDRLQAAAHASADAIAPTQLETTSAAAETARGKLQRAEADLARLDAIAADAVLRAPFDGVVTDRRVDPGALVEAGTRGAGGTAGGGGTAIVRLEHIDTVRVFIDVPEADVSAVRGHEPVRLETTALAGRVFHATITRISDALDPSTRTMKVEVDVVNRDHILFPGMYVIATLDLGRNVDALTVPAEALRTDANGAFVWVVQQGLAHRQRVRVGSDTGVRVEIVEGVGPDDLIVLTGQPLLDEGRPVHAQEVTQ